MSSSLFRLCIGRQTFFVLPLSLLLILLLGVCAHAEQATAPDKIKVRLQWWAQAQFAGILMAKEKGLYAAQGLDVDIIRGGPDKGLFDELYTGEAQFATAQLGDALLKLHPQESDGPVNVLQIVHRPNTGILTRAADNLRVPEDLDGKNVSVWSGGPAEKYLLSLSAQNIHPRLYPQYSTINLFLQRAVSACSGMLFGDYVSAQLAGYTREELHFHRLDDLGWNIPEDGLYTMASTWRNHPDLVRRFVQATRDGWIAARNNPKEATEYIIQYRKMEHQGVSKVGNRLMLDEMLVSVFASDTPFACLTKESYATAVRLLEIQNAPAYEHFVMDSCHE